MDIVNINLNELSNIFDYILDKVEDCYSEDVKISITNYLNTVKFNVPKLPKHTYSVATQRRSTTLRCRMIVLNNNETDMAKEEYINSPEKILDIKTNDLHYVWESMINKYEGMNYCILVDNKLLCSGSFDPGDYEIIKNI